MTAAGRIKYFKKRLEAKKTTLVVYGKSKKNYLDMELVLERKVGMEPINILQGMSVGLE